MGNGTDFEQLRQASAADRLVRGSLGQILSRDQVRRERLLDMEDRLAPYRRIAFGFLALALLAMSPEVGYWWFLPLALALASFTVADRMTKSSRHPERWVSVAWALSPAMLAGAIVATGGLESPVTMWFAIPAVTLGARFETQGVLAGTVWILLLLVVSTVSPDPGAVLDRSELLVAPLAMVLATVSFSMALADSDRTHRRRSAVDDLTGLLSRTALHQKIGDLEEETRAGRGEPLACVLCDLDHFKRVNDQHGHATGDAVLRQIAYVLRAALRASDFIYRVGGEEFLIVLPRADRAAASMISERMVEAIREADPAGVTVTASAGVAVTGGEHLDFDRLMLEADAALYAAKASGRDRVRFADEIDPEALPISAPVADPA